MQFAIAASFAFISITISSLVYNRYLRNISHVRVITTSSIIMLIFPWLNILYGRKVINPDPSTYLNVTSLIGGFLSHIAFMPLAVLAAKHSPAHIEATMYAFYMALINLCSVIGYSLSALILQLLNIQDFESQNIWWYYIFDITFDMVSIYFVQKFIYILD